MTARGGWPARGRTSSHNPLSEQPAGKVNVTDPDSRNLKTTRGWVQGYNAQAAVTPEQIVVAAEISTESLDTANLEPMVNTAGEELRSAGVSAKPGVILADAGYWKNDAIEAIVSQGDPDTDRPGCRQPQRTKARPPRRPLRLHPPRARDRLAASSST